MSPELGFSLFLILIYGPTALWVFYRSIRGHQRARVPEPFDAELEPMGSFQLAPDEFEALVDPDAFWVCGTCRSLNIRVVSRCYSCRTARGPADQPAPGELPVRSWVPVMADGIARSSREEAGTTVALAIPMDAPPAPDPRPPTPVRALSAAQPGPLDGALACPFLGSRNDPSTRYDFPDPANFCHAPSERGARPVASSRRLVAGTAGTRRAQPIDVGHQMSRCLTAAHGQCARYPAAEVVAATR